MKSVMACWRLRASISWASRAQDFLTAVVRFAQGELIGQLTGLGQGLTFGGDCVQHGENSVLELLFAGGGDAFIFADVIGDPLFIG